MRVNVLLLISGLFGVLVLEYVDVYSVMSNRLIFERERFDVMI